MKITMARYYTPSDANIDKLGIPPDREVLFPEITEKDQKILSDLLQTTKLADFVAGKQTLSSEQAEAFARQLAGAYPVEVRVLKRLVMQEYYRTHLSPLNDLEYDVQLRAAIDILLHEDVPALLKTTKTVRELQDAAKAAAEAAKAATAVASPAATDASAPKAPAAKP